MKFSDYAIAPTLTNTYNQCITSGCSPDIFKIAEVIPLYKSSPKTLCSNYCLISILTPFSKIFKKCQPIQLYDYLTKTILLKKPTWIYKTFIPNGAVTDYECL